MNVEIKKQTFLSPQPPEHRIKLSTASGDIIDYSLKSSGQKESAARYWKKEHRGKWAEKGESPTKRLIEMKESHWNHTSGFKERQQEEKYALNYVISPKKSYVVEPCAGKIDYDSIRLKLEDESKKSESKKSESKKKQDLIKKKEELMEEICKQEVTKYRIMNSRSDASLRHNASSTVMSASLGASKHDLSYNEKFRHGVKIQQKHGVRARLREENLQELKNEIENLRHELGEVKGTLRESSPDQEWIKMIAHKPN
jgi:hypothetical protein